MSSTSTYNKKTAWTSRLLTQRYNWIWFFKKSSGTSFFIIFCARFSKKMLLKSYSVNWPNFSVLLHLLQELSGNMYIVIVCYSFCLHDQKFRMKTEISQEWKDLFRRNEKRFLQVFQFQFLQDFQFQFLQDFQCVFNTVSLLHSLQSRRALLRHISLFRRNTIGNFKSISLYFHISKSIRC